MRPAARITDMHACPMSHPGPVPHVGGPVTSGAAQVFIGNQPAARVGDELICVAAQDAIAVGEPSVLIEGQPAARLGDATEHGGRLTAGCPTVFIGSTAQAVAMHGAAVQGKPFCQNCNNPPLFAVSFIDDGGVPWAKRVAQKQQLEISNRVTTDALPDSFTDPSNDRDNFKIEVLDPNVSADSISAADVEVEVLTSGGEAFEPPRKLKVELKRVPKTNRFRSKYLRLVVDEQDLAVKPAQILLADWNPKQPKVQILNQIVRVTYTASDGPITAQARIGKNRQFIKICLHVVRFKRGGAGVIKLQDGITRVRKWFRRVFAQISMAPLLLQARAVNPPENLISISNDHGASATGGAGSQIAFTIRALHRKPRGKPKPLDTIQTVGPYTPIAGATPLATAQALAALIAKESLFQVRVIQNPPALDMAQGSADLIISDPAGGWVTIDGGVIQTDLSQTVTVGRVTPGNFVGWADSGQTNWVVGSIQQRTLLQAYDTGSDRIDLFVIGTFTTAHWGHAMMPGTIYAAGKQAISAVTMSAFVAAQPMTGPDFAPYVAPHECGHVLLDAIHAMDGTQLMWDQPLSTSPVVGGSKRFSEAAVPFDFPSQPLVQEARIRSLGKSVLAPFK